MPPVIPLRLSAAIGPPLAPRRQLRRDVLYAPRPVPSGRPPGQGPCRLIPWHGRQAKPDTTGFNTGHKISWKRCHPALSRCIDRHALLVTRRADCALRNRQCLAGRDENTRLPTPCRLRRKDYTATAVVRPYGPRGLRRGAHVPTTLVCGGIKHTRAGQDKMEAPGLRFLYLAKSEVTLLNDVNTLILSILQFSISSDRTLHAIFAFTNTSSMRVEPVFFRCRSKAR
jgi:hypothetical protein